MPRASPFRIVLSRDEARELTRRANKYTWPYYQVVRAKMILLAAEGWGNDEIAAIRVGRQHQRQHGLALAQRRCDPALAASLLDLSP